MAPKRKAADEEEPSAKRTKAEPKAKAKAKARATDADLDKELNDMIQHAKDGEFDEVFKVLDKYPPYVNEKPEERKWCTLHQACFWGNLEAVKKLVEKYDADIFLPTKDEKTPVQVAEEEGHAAVVKYLQAQEKKKKAAADAAAAPPARNASSDRNRITAERNDGKKDEPDMQLEGVKDVTLKLGAEGGGILCGAALVYSGAKRQKAICISERKFKGAINHSGDTNDGTKSVHTIDVNFTKMPKDVDKIYLTLCSCGPANLSKFKKPTIELLGDGAPMIRYNLADAGTAMSTVMAVLEKQTGSWTASPVGAISGKKFCGNYKAAECLIASGGEDDSGDGKNAKKAPKAKAKAAARGSSGRSKSELSGKKVCFTGALSITRANAKAKAEAAGAKVVGDVSGQTQIVIVGSGAGSKLAVAEGFGCDIWQEEEFLAAVD